MSKKIKKGKRTGLAGVLDAYNHRDTGPGNAANTALKSVVDAILGVPIGIAIGGAAGLWSLPFGLVLIGAGHHFKDQSGLLRITGAAAIAYGVAKNIEFNNQAKAAKASGVSGFAGATEGVKERLKTVKDDLLAAYFLDRLFKKDDAGQTQTKSAEAPIEEGATIGSLDLSEMDLFEQFNQQEADEYEQEMAQQELYNQPDQLTEFNASADYSQNESPQVSPEAAFAIINEEPDYSDF